MKYHIDDVKRLLTKQMAKTITAEEAHFLSQTRPLIKEDIWNEFVIDAALDLPEDEITNHQEKSEKLQYKLKMVVRDLQKE